MKPSLNSMFIVSLSYKVPFEEIDKHIDAHILFLEKHYARQKFVCSGRKNPRTGGIIMAYNLTKEELETLLHEDPFFAHGIADYEIIEFIPTKYDENFRFFTPQKPETP